MINSTRSTLEDLPDPGEPVLNSGASSVDASSDPSITRDHVAGVAEILAHRIRSLVTCIEAYGDLLGDTLARQEQRDLLFRIFETTGRIEHILADLLLFSRPLQPAFADVTTATVVESLRVTLDEDVAERLRIVRKVPADLKISCDERLMRQALLALLKNAVEASPGGSPISLHISTEAAETGRSRLLIAVENEGRFAAATDPDLIYRPFYSTRPQNLGLGLAIARQIVAVHGGELFHTAGENTATFVLALPVAAR